MAFSWSGFNPTFLKEIIKASEIENAKLYIESDDEDALASCVNNICSIPDKKFIMNYRQIIEQYLILNYKEEVRKICKSLNITENSYNEMQSCMTKKYYLRI